MADIRALRSAVWSALDELTGGVYDDRIQGEPEPRPARVLGRGLDHQHELVRAARGDGTFLLTDIEGSTRLLGVGQRGDGRRGADPLPAAGRGDRSPRRCAPGRAGRGRQRGGGVLAGIGRGRGGARGPASPCSRSAWPDGTSTARADRAAHRRGRSCATRATTSASRSTAARGCARSPTAARRVLSRAVHDLVVDRLPDGVELVDLRRAPPARPRSPRARLRAGASGAAGRRAVALRSLDALPNNLPGAADQLRRARGASSASSQTRSAQTRLLTLTGAGGCGQDPAGVAARRRHRWSASPTAAWWVDLAPLSRSRWRSGRRWPSRWAYARSAGLTHARRSRPRTCGSREALLRARQLRAPARGVRRDRGGAAANRARGDDPGHEPRAARPAGRDDLARALAFAAEGEPQREPIAALAQSEPVRLFIERARQVRPNFAVTQRERSGGRADLPGARRHTAGDRAGRGAGADARRGADRGGAGRPLPAADRRRRARRCRVSRRCARRSTGATSC